MRSPILASALLFVLSAAAPSPAQEKADAKAAAEAAKATAELLAPLLEELKTAAPALFTSAAEHRSQGDE